MDDNFEGLPSFKKREEKSKDIKGLLKTVFSDRSLSRSLEKLANIGRNTSPQVHKTGNYFSNTSSREKISLRDRAFTQSSTEIKEVTKHSAHAYIIAFKREIVLSYLLNTGYIGIYEPTYKLLFNKNQGLYFEAKGE
jgi:hypothetical protein